MLLVVDIGNTHICLGIFDSKNLVQEFRLSTNRKATVDELSLALHGWLKTIGHRSVWQGGVISSVVPELDFPMETAVRETLKAPVLRITPDVKLPIKNQYHPPQAVGADRLMNAVAAVEEFSAPVLIVDLGTAITVDAVSSQRIYLGGAILPGLQLASEALALGTALLPRIELRTPKSVIGQATEESMRSGVIWGAVGAITFLVKQMKSIIGQKAKVIATGGLAAWVMPHCPALHVLRPHLVLQGLRLTWEYQRPYRVKRR